MKIKTVESKVKQLEDLDFDNLDFGKVHNGKTSIDGEIKSIKKSLRSVIKNLSKAETSYINNNENKELRSTFGDLVDICGGDSAKALQIHNSLIASYIARNKAKN